MKKYLLMGVLLFFVLGVVAQERSIVQVSTESKDVSMAGNYYYTHFAKTLDKLILAKSIQVYKDEELKQPVDLETFKKETLVDFMWQIVNPANIPPDPFDLIDTLIAANQAMTTAQSMTWKKSSIEIKTKNLSGPVTYYLSIKEIEKLYKHRGYILLRSFSQGYGAINPEVIQENAGKFLTGLCRPLFTPPSDIYENSMLNREMKSSDLHLKTTFTRGNRESVTTHYYPSSADSITGFMIGYRSDSEAGEIEFNYFSMAPTYSLFNQNNAWYWVGSDEAENLFSKDQWICIQVIQSYTMRKQINPYFDSLE